MRLITVTLGCLLIGLNALAPQALFAQPKGSIRGMIREQNAPVPFAYITLYAPTDTSKAVKGTLSASTGTFTLAGVPMGTYLLRVQRVGFVIQQQRLILSDAQPTLVVDDILLKPDVKLLESIEVVAQKAIIQKTSTGFIVQASATLTQEGGTAVDLLQNTPTVNVDAEGGVTLRGKSPLILINGRNSGITNLDQIPAGSIESVEIINNPSAQYDAEAEAGIINIVLKKNKQGGTNGAVALGLGYGAFGRANASVLLNHREGAWNIGFGIDTRVADRTRSITADRTNFTAQTSLILQQRNDTRTDRNHNVRLSTDYEFSTQSSIVFEGVGNIPQRDNYETLNSLLIPRSTVIANQNSRYSAEFQRENAFEFSSTFKQKFHDPRQSVTIIASTSINRDNESTDIATQTLSFDNKPIGAPYLQQTRNQQNTNLSTLRADFTHPLSEIGSLETGIKSIFRDLTADFRQLAQENNVFILNPRASNVFTFSEGIHSAYALYKSTPKQSSSIRYEAGMRMEYWSNNGTSSNGANTVQQKFLELFPSGNIAWLMESGDMLKFSVSRRVNRPGFGQLNPFTDITDSLNQRSGNPTLLPEFVNVVETGYSTELNTLSLSATLYYRWAKNSIIPLTRVRADGVAETLPLNVGQTQTFGMESIATYYPTKHININASVSVFRQDLSGSTAFQDVATGLLSWSGKLIATATPWEGGKIQIISIYNAPVVAPQGTRVAVYNTDFGIQQEIFHGKARIGAVVTDVFNTQVGGVRLATQDFISNRTFKVDTRAILLTFAFTFNSAFKEKLMENSYSND